MEIQEQDGVTLQDNTEFKSPMRAAMWDAWWMKARDPKQFLGRWAREGAPLGIAKLIPDSGIFPQVELDESLEEKTDMSVLMYKRAASTEPRGFPYRLFQSLSLLYNSYDVSLENLELEQPIIP